MERAKWLGSTYFNVPMTLYTVVGPWILRDALRRTTRAEEANIPESGFLLKWCIEKNAEIVVPL